MIYKVEYVLIDVIKIGWGYVVIVCDDYFVFFIYYIIYKDNYYLERSILFGFI